MGLSTSGQRVHLEQRNGASRLGCATIVTDEGLRRDYEKSVRQLLEALEARLLGWPSEEKLAAIGAVAAAVEDGRQVTVRVKPFTVRF
jgi:hypothetical protein